MVDDIGVINGVENFVDSVFLFNLPIGEKLSGVW